MIAICVTVVFNVVAMVLVPLLPRLSLSLLLLLLLHLLMWVARGMWVCARAWR